MFYLKDKTLENIDNGVECGAISNDDLVQIIEHAGAYLNLETISNYARNNGISYNGAKNHRNVVSLFGCKLIIDNE